MPSAPALRSTLSRKGTVADIASGNFDGLRSVSTLQLSMEVPK
jgi:hypothetical protein